MKRTFLLITVGLLCFALLSATEAQKRTMPLALSVQTGALVFTNVTVIDGTGTGAQPAMTVVIRKDRIESIGENGQISIPPGSRVVNASGKFMIPGLWDMHVHLTDARPSAMAALVANGVTGVRDSSFLKYLCSGSVAYFRAARSTRALDGFRFYETFFRRWRVTC